MIIRWPKHIRYSCLSTCTGCVFCNGGLFLCTCCGLAEAELTTDCPGEKVPISLASDIVLSQLDYRWKEGWVQAPSKFKAN